MSKVNEVKTWSLDKCNDELGAAGHYSCHNDVSEAREAVVAMLGEYGVTVPVAVTIYWDRSDIENQGWAYRAMYQHEREESGSLGSNDLHEAVDEACEILGIQGVEHEFSLSILEGGVAKWTV